MDKLIRIGTRESQLAVWQATQVQKLLAQFGFPSELVYIKSEGDIDLQTPLYEMGVQGIFTRSLDIALLSGKIDIAVHSMKDVPTQLPAGIVQAAVLERASYKDLLVLKNVEGAMAKWSEIYGGAGTGIPVTIATSSIRRKAQWLHRFPGHSLENLRGNVNTRLKKVAESNWFGAIFAAAGLERIGLRPENSVELDWMLPAPAQGAIMVVCREDDALCLEACSNFNHAETALCTKVEKDFLRILMGGCSTPISALAQIQNGQMVFKGNILSLNGQEKIVVDKTVSPLEADNLGTICAHELLANGGQKIAEEIRNAG